MNCNTTHYRANSSSVPGDPTWSFKLAVALIGFGAASMMFLAVLYSTGLVIGAVASSTSAANVAAAGVWLIVVVASVPTIDFVARIVAPLIPAEVVQAQRQERFAARLRQEQLDVGAGFLRLTGPDWRQAEMTAQLRDEMRTRWAVRARSIREDVERIDREADRGERRERSMWMALSWCTPGTLFFDTTSRLAATGLTSVDAWIAASRTRQTLLNNRLFDDPPRLTLLLPDRVGTTMTQMELKGPLEVDTLDLPEPPDTPLRQALTDSLGPFLGLGLCQLVMTAVAFLTFRRIRY